jgi:hypothetical protein
MQRRTVESIVAAVATVVVAFVVEKSNLKVKKRIYKRRKICSRTPKDAQPFVYVIAEDKDTWQDQELDGKIINTISEYVNVFVTMQPCARKGEGEGEVRGGRRGIKREQKMAEDFSPSVITQFLLTFSFLLPLPPPPPLLSPSQTSPQVPEVNVTSECGGITSRVKVPWPRRADTCWSNSQLRATIPEGP